MTCLGFLTLFDEEERFSARGLTEERRVYGVAVSALGWDRSVIRWRRGRIKKITTKKLKSGVTKKIGSTVGRKEKKTSSGGFLLLLVNCIALSSAYDITLNWCRRQESLIFWSIVFAQWHIHQTWHVRVNGQSTWWALRLCAHFCTLLDEVHEAVVTHCVLDASILEWRSICK